MHVGRRLDLRMPRICVHGCVRDDRRQWQSCQRERERERKRERDQEERLGVGSCIRWGLRSGKSVPLGACSALRVLLCKVRHVIEKSRGGSREIQGGSREIQGGIPRDPGGS